MRGKIGLLFAVLLVALSIIAACGGGGGGGTTPSNNTTTYSISGTITSSGTGTSGITVFLSGASTASATTDASGNYSYTGLANGSYTMTPSKTGYTFTPTSLSVTVSGANMMSQNFIATGGGTWTLLKLPDTGQTTCYDGQPPTMIACSGTGQDGAYILNPPSYTDNGNGTITDNVTGLIWQKQDDATTRTWDAAITYCDGNSAGLPGTGWRLPGVMELTTINRNSTTAPPFNATYFPNTQSSRYWSSTTNAFSASSAWGVYFNPGYYVDYYDKTNLFYARCVRGGQ